MKEEEEKAKRMKKEETKQLFLEAVSKEDTFEHDAVNRHLEENMPADNDDEDDPNDVCSTLYIIPELAL